MGTAAGFSFSSWMVSLIATPMGVMDGLRRPFSGLCGRLAPLGISGSGARGGGAGGPSPIKDTPKSIDGREVRLRGTRLVVRDAGRAGRPSGSWPSNVVGRSTDSSSSFGVLGLNEDVVRTVCMVAMEREGFRLRIGTVVTRGCGVGAPLLRTEARNGAGLERTCKLVGRASRTPLAWASAFASMTAEDGERFNPIVCGCTKMTGGCGGAAVGNKESLADGDRFGDLAGSLGGEPDIEDLRPGIYDESMVVLDAMSTLAVKVVIAGIGENTMGSSEARFAAFGGVPSTG